MGRKYIRTTGAMEHDQIKNLLVSSGIGWGLEESFTQKSVFKIPIPFLVRSPLNILSPSLATFHISTFQV